jgi:tetratricopeptide repeat protein 8
MLCLQMGVVNAETWTNLGLCCFYAGQYDFTFSCFERALAMADDAALPDIWYNIGQVRSTKHSKYQKLC